VGRKSFTVAASVRLAGAMGKGAEIFAEVEGADTLVERGAAAAEEALEKGSELEGADDVLIDFGQLAGGELFPARADGSVIAEAAKEELDFGKGEAHVGGEADEKDAVEGVGGIAALAAEALGRGEQTAFFIVADGGGVEAGAAGELADFHSSFSLCN
jgi:hypothetical protein